MPEQSHHVRHLAAALAAGPIDDAEVLKARVKPLVGDLRKAKLHVLKRLRQFDLLHVQLHDEELFQICFLLQH